MACVTHHSHAVRWRPPFLLRSVGIGLSQRVITQTLDELQLVLVGCVSFGTSFVVVGALMSARLPSNAR